MRQEGTIHLEKAITTRVEGISTILVYATSHHQATLSACRLQVDAVVTLYQWEIREVEMLRLFLRVDSVQNMQVLFHWILLVATTLHSSTHLYLRIHWGSKESVVLEYLLSFVLQCLFWAEFHMLLVYDVSSWNLFIKLHYSHDLIHLILFLNFLEKLVILTINYLYLILVEWYF